MQNREDKLLENKRRIDAERKERAIRRRQQYVLRAITPGTATPLSVMMRAGK